jgi:hypothetical protein
MQSSSTENRPAFIEPGVNLTAGHPDLLWFVNLPKEKLRSRWFSDQGRQILEVWSRSGFDRSTLDTLVGRYYGHTDLRGVTLSQVNLDKAKLDSTDFFFAELVKTSLREADLTDSWLSESDIRGAIFDWANMDAARLDNVNFDKDTRFVGVNLNRINFTLAALLQDLALTQQRIANLEKAYPIAAAFLRMTSDYGRSFGRFFFWSALVVVAFGGAYCFIPNAIGHRSAPITIGKCMYFSFVAFTTLGFGEVVPTSPIGFALVVAEVIIGYVMLGLLVGIISRRIVAP